MSNKILTKNNNDFVFTNIQFLQALQGLLLGWICWDVHAFARMSTYGIVLTNSVDFC